MKAVITNTDAWKMPRVLGALPGWKGAVELPPPGMPASGSAAFPLTMSGGTGMLRKCQYSQSN